MTEMRLRSMIISGTWMPIMTPVHFGYQHRLDLTSYNIPFVIDTGLVRDSINEILCLVQPRYRQILIHSFSDIHPRGLVTRCAALWMESHRVGPEYLSSTWIDKSRSCNNTPQHISTKYPRYNRYGQHISVRRWDVSQSIQEDSNYASTHGQRNGLLHSVITTLNLHKFDRVVMLTLGNVHHVIHPMR